MYIEHIILDNESEDSFFMNPITYLQETIAELGQVRWPTRQETIKLTVIVIGISLLMAIYVGGLDIMFTKIVTLLVK